MNKGMKGMPPKGAAPGGRPKMDKDLIIEMDKTIDHLTEMGKDLSIEMDKTIDHVIEMDKDLSTIIETKEILAEEDH